MNRIAAGHVRRADLIGHSLPRKCGTATFTTDLHQAITSSRPGFLAVIASMNSGDNTHDYPDSVAFQIDERRPVNGARTSGHAAFEKCTRRRPKSVPRGVIVGAWKGPPLGALSMRGGNLGGVRR